MKTINKEQIELMIESLEELSEELSDNSHGNLVIEQWDLLAHLKLVRDNFVLDPVIKRSFMVSYLGTDDQGQIVKGIEVVAEDESRAIEVVLEVNGAREIYGATDIIA